MRTHCNHPSAHPAKSGGTDPDDPVEQLRREIGDDRLQAVLAEFGETAVFIVAHLRYAWIPEANWPLVEIAMELQRQHQARREEK